MNDYKDHIRRSLGLTEAQFIPASLLEKDEIDPEELEKGTGEEAGEHGMPPKKARQTAKDHLGEPNQAHYYTGMEKAKKSGMLKDQAISPTARPTPIIALGIRGSSSGGLPSGVDQGRGDISPSKVGGYDRVQSQNLNHHSFGKTPSNPEIKQTTPVNPDPSTGQGVTHPHQIQVTAHEEPQALTGASTDSDDTLKLKSAVPKGIDIDIAETDSEEETKNEDNNTAMIPSTSLSETFDRHKKLMEAKLGLKKCPCTGGECKCGPNCKCKKTGVCECATCGCGNPSDTHSAEKPEQKSGFTSTKKKYVDPKTKTVKDVGWVSKKKINEGGICSACSGSGEGPADGTKCSTCGGSGDSDHHWGRKSHERDPDDERDSWADRESDNRTDENKKPRVCYHCKKPHPCACDKKDEEDAKLQRNNPEEYRKRFGMKIDKRSDLDPRDRGETVECKECHNPFNYRLVAEVSMGAVKCPVCDAVLDQNGTVLAEGKHKAGCECGFCKNKGSFGKKKKEVEEGEDEDNQKDNPDFKEKDEKQWRKDRAESDAGKEVRKQQKIDESYAAPFQRMRSLAGVGNMILTSNGLMENKNDPGANKPFNTHWKMDKEKAGFVKIDEEKLNKVKASLERKSKRGTLSDDELELAKKLTEVLKRRQAKA